MKTFKPTLTKKRYIKAQIVKCLNEAVAYEMQKNVLIKALGNEETKEKAVTAITALDAQLKAGEATLAAWKELYYRETNLVSKIKNFFIK